ncbi:hypothetical protein WN51_03895 [Melipona quadrifasciata]|uniref:Uncharacterized protein n=1 Tax=Melipona quadrifasciata TaxID=166423 RepID=A0A0M8ZS43_9HYME|nr:hypothetical protein WN51_03895 [Melipona quadrifasciata]
MGVMTYGVTDARLRTLLLLSLGPPFYLFPQDPILEISSNFNSSNYNKLTKIHGISRINPLRFASVILRLLPRANVISRSWILYTMVRVGKLIQANKSRLEFHWPRYSREEVTWREFRHSYERPTKTEEKAIEPLIGGADDWDSKGAVGTEESRSSNKSTQKNARMKLEVFQEKLEEAENGNPVYFQRKRLRQRRTDCTTPDIKYCDRTLL